MSLSTIVLALFSLCIVGSGSRAATIDIPFPAQLSTSSSREIVMLVINVTQGDIVRWKFSDADKAANHSVVQVSLENPCTPLKDGFASPVGALNTEGEFEIAIDEALVTLPIYWSCASTSSDPQYDHCQAGEVGILASFDVPQEETDRLHMAFHTAPHDGALGHVAATPVGSGSHGARVVKTSAKKISGATSSTTASASAPGGDDPRSSSTTAASARSTTSPAIFIAPPLIGAVALGSLVFLVLFLRRRKRRGRQTVTPLMVPSDSRTPVTTPHPASDGHGSNSTECDLRPATFRIRPSPLVTKAKTLGVFRHTAPTEADSASHDPTPVGGPEPDQVPHDGLQWQALQRAADGAGFSLDALLTSLRRVRRPDHAHEEAEEETMPPRYDG